jgi:hypothetical protein
MSWLWTLEGSSFPRRRESSSTGRPDKEDSRFRGNDGWRLIGDDHRRNQSALICEICGLSIVKQKTLAIAGQGFYC